MKLLRHHSSTPTCVFPTINNMSPSAPQDFGTPLLLEDYMTVTPSVTTTSQVLCAVCHSAALPRRCSTCKSLYYCSPACQILDWSVHKQLCKTSASSASFSARPDKSYRRALYLLETSVKPRFAWIKFGDDGKPLDMAKCFPQTITGQVKTIAFHNRYIPYWLQISYDSNISGSALGENACVLHLLSLSALSSCHETLARKEAAWRGPLVVLAYGAEDGLSKPALDFDTSGLGPVLEYLKLRMEYGGPVFVEQPQERYSEEEWKKLLGEARH